MYIYMCIYIYIYIYVCIYVYIYIYIYIPQTDLSVGVLTVLVKGPCPGALKLPSCRGA